MVAVRADRTLPRFAYACTLARSWLKRVCDFPRRRSHKGTIAAFAALVMPAMRVVTVLAVLVIAGCTTPRGSFCDIAKPFRPSEATIASLTDAEVEQLLSHNEKLRRICGVRPWSI